MMGATAPVVEHAYAQPGRYEARLATAAGESTVDAVAYRVSFDAAARARFGSIGRFSGSIWPAQRGARVELLGPRGAIARGKTRPNGGFALEARLRGTGPFRVRVAGLVSGEASVRLRPALDVRFVGSGIVGEPLRPVAGVHPAGAGALTASVRRNGRRGFAGPLKGPLRLATGTPAAFRVHIHLAPGAGYLAAARTLRGAVVRPALALGSHGPGVRALQRRLVELRYALPRIDGFYGLTTFQTVLAFQKLAGLARTGRVDATTWRRLSAASTPRAPGTHLEVSKSRQALLLFREHRVGQSVYIYW